jgi:hypothetical protein
VLANSAKGLPYSEIALVLVRCDHIARVIVNANHRIMRADAVDRILELPPQGDKVSKEKADADQSNSNTQSKA